MPFTARPKLAEDTPLDSAALHEFVARAAEGGDDDVLAAVTHVMTGLLGDRGVCILAEGAPCIALSTSDKYEKNSSIDLDLYPEVKAAASGRSIVVIHDVQTDPRLEPVRPALPAGLVGVVAIPLVVRDVCRAVVLVQSLRPSRFETLALATAELIARFGALLLARAQSGGIVTAAAPDLSTGPLTVERDSRKNSRILIIDDDDDASATLADLLDDEGYCVERAPDGPAGIRRARDLEPDLVLLDVNLPGMSGFEVASQLRLLALTHSIPILFLSGTDRLPVHVREAGLEHVDFMLKPFVIDELLTRIHQAVVQGQRDKRLQQAADRDELTGVGNLRSLRRRLKLERTQFERYGHPLSLAMVDVDKLKPINDEYGHVVGSEVLREIAKVLATQARDSDLAVRYGGDEFVVLLPHTNLAEAEIFAKRLVSEVARITIKGARATVSVGVACLTQQGGGESNEDFLARADGAAYEAKRCGGNCVRVAK